MNNDTWITVTNTKRNRKKKPPNQQPATLQTPFSTNKFPPSETDISTLETTLRSHRERFKSTTFAHNLRTLLSRALHQLPSPENEPKIDHAICLALGSLSTENLELAKRSAWQFTAFLDMCDALGCGIKMVAQDPRFSDADRRVLGRFGVEVVERPSANAFVTTRCFLYAPFLEQAVLLGEVLRGADPGIYLGVGPAAMREWVERQEFVGDYAELVEVFEGGRTVADLPGDFEFGGTVFEGLSVCWRAVEDEEG
jgi:hypothetical protein